MKSQQKIKHLIWRAGFGPEYEWWKKNKSRPLADVLESVFKDSESSEPLKVVDDQLDHSEYKPKMATRQERSKKRNELQDMDRDLAIAWLDKMVYDRSQLREKMTFFWANHFCTRNLFPDYIQRMNNTLRRNALGNFKTLVIEASQEPAMLQSLGLIKNVKEHPNENFARELMELFTIGRGNYSETDIKESARAFTGWRSSITRESVTKRKTHDQGIKTFMGKKGHFTGFDIIDILLEKKETAFFISLKMYKAFVNDSVIDEGHVTELAEAFYTSNYNIGTLVRKVFSSDWFYDDRNSGAHIKSPVELIVGLKRAFGVTFNSKAALIKAQRVMGQVLFAPPNVAGWPGGKNWIDSSSLLFRLRLASNILNSGTIDLDGKENEAEESLTPRQIESRKNAVDKNFNTSMDWTVFDNNFEQKSQNALIASVSDFLLSTGRNNEDLMSVFDENDTSARAIAMKLVSMPEYQVC